jgi:hypothetical protein
MIERVHCGGQSDEERDDFGFVGATREMINFSSAFVDVNIAVRWDHNWRIRSVVPAGVAVLVLADLDDADEEAGGPRFRARPSD